MTMKFIKNRNEMTSPTGTLADSISWDQFPDGLIIDLTKFPKSSDSKHLQFTILSPNNPERRTQDESQKDKWDGAFDSAAKECVLYTKKAGPITIRFDKGIRGAGANIDINKGVLFEATIKAFQGGNEIMLPVGGMRSDGKSDHAGLGTAIFVGFLEDDPNTKLGIDTVEFHIKLLDPKPSVDTSFAINSLALVLE